MDLSGQQELHPKDMRCFVQEVGVDQQALHRTRTALQIVHHLNAVPVEPHVVLLSDINSAVIV